MGAVQSVWGVLRNITCKPEVMKNIIRKEQAIDLLDTGLNVVVEMKAVDGREAGSGLEDAFITMSNVVSNGYVDKSQLYEKDVIPKCMQAFRKDRSELVTNKAINFFNWCHNKDLLEGASDSVYEVLLPFFTEGLKAYPRNEKIQMNTFNFLEYSCTVVTDKSIIEKAGAMEALSVVLVVPNISIAKKKKVRKLIMKIAG